jgi:arsenite/tail-anchored protein-transporting ATPase
MAPADGHGALAARRVPVLLNALPLGGHRVLFVGGKGGVGKTTTAAALGVSLAARGERCLLVSTDPAHSLGDLFDIRIGDDKTVLGPQLHGLEVDPDAQVERHLEVVRRAMRDFVMPDMYGEIDRQMELTRLAPGAVEAAMLERMAQVMIEDSVQYDRVIFDTAPTGHTLRLLSLPEIMSAWTDGLLRHRERSDTAAQALKRMQRVGSGDDLSYIDQAADEVTDARSQRIREMLMARRRTFAQARRLLLDPSTTAFVLVMIPEKLPIAESRKALEVLRRVEVPVLGLVVNRVLPRAPLGDFLEQRREQETRYLRQIEELFDGIPRVEVPLLTRDVEGLEALRAVGRHLLGV